MRKLLVLVFLTMMSCSAFCSEKKHWKDKPKDGRDGINGIDGINGRDGQSIVGPSGEDGLDATRANVGAEIEWHEWERASLSSGYRFDTLHHGHTVDMAILKIRVGPSYAEREIGALNAKIERLSTMLEGQNQGKVREITIRGAK